MRSLDTAARVRDDHGQSLVEVALLLPLLLFIVLGLIDLSRAYAVKTAATSAAREAAIYAARDPQATAQQICARAMTELANGTTASPCALDPINPLVADEVWRSARPAATVVCNRVGDGSTVTVTVTTQVQLVSTYLVGRAFGLGSLVVGGAATFGGLAQ
jgi:Flp pilus assembly protein TadG